MTRLVNIFRKFRTQERGAALVEMALVVPMFLLLMFGIVDYGRLYWSTTTAQKAMQKAARLATVGPAQCGALPASHELVNNPTGTPRFGTLCRVGGICEVPNLPAPCRLDTSTAYGERIWDEIQPLLPPGTTPTNVQFAYTHDPRLGFLGGPYTPVVTAELIDVDFDFVMPLAGLAALASNSPAVTSNTPNSISLPAMSTSVPAEDLGIGAAE
jgi:hypothetical protein